MVGNRSGGEAGTPAWLRGFSGWRWSALGPDLVAGLTLAAVAIPEQMATARLAGFGPEKGFLTLIAGAVGFALFGANRFLSVGADSTIAPIFAGALATIAAAGSADYAAAAAALALGVGLALAVAGLFRLSFVADLLSIPVTTGFLAGIAVHIFVSQAPAIVGVDVGSGATVDRLLAIAESLPRANAWTLSLGLGVYAAMELGERFFRRAPSGLIALAVATALTVYFRLEARGVTTLGALPPFSLTPALPIISYQTFAALAPLAAIIALVVMVQTALTTRSFVSDPERGPDVATDFVGVAAANLVAGFVGAFPLDASPPRTAIVAETGGVSQVGALVSAAIALIVALYGGGLIAHAPHAGFAGVLLFVARRIVRVGDIIAIARRSAPEFLLIPATLTAIVLLPIEQGVALGIAMSILHGVWTTTRTRLVEFERIPGTSIWWPRSAVVAGERAPGVRVVALQAPLSFLNAYEFQQALGGYARAGVSLLVIEANALVEIDYTGASALSEAIARLRKAGVDVAFARLESVRAQQSFERLGLAAEVGRDHLFHSVEEAIEALAPRSKGGAK
ncbi:MAG: SulP family inorganic anion transporter [Roseiarcus sp.]